MTPPPLPPDPDTNAPTSSRFRHAKSTFRVLGRVAMFVAPVALLAVIAATVIYVRLMHSPVSLKFLAGPIERGISAELGGMTAMVDDTVLQKSASGGFEFRLVNLRLLDEDGGAVASAPVAAVVLDHWRLFGFQFVPSRVDFIEPRLAVSYTPDEGLALRFKETPPTRTEDGTPILRPGVNDAPATPAAGAAAPEGNIPTLLKRLDLARVLSEYTARARRGAAATSALTQIGLKNAIVDVDYDGSRSQWKLREMAIDLDHRRQRSLISGHANIESERGPWTVSFITDDSEKTNTLSLKTSVRDLVPSTLARVAPELSLLRTFDLPVAVNANINLKTTGDLNSAGIAVELGRGLIDFGPSLTTPLLIDAGLLTMTYQAADQRLVMMPSTVRWGESHVTLAGTMTGETAAGKPAGWAFDIKSVEGSLAAEEFRVAPVALERFTVAGRIDPQASRIEVSQLNVLAGGGELGMAGQFVVGNRPEAGVNLAARVSPMSIDTLKLFWPRMVAPRARDWVGGHAREGRVTAADLTFASGGFAGPDALPAAGGKRERTRLSLDAENVSFLPFLDGPVVQAPKLTVRVINTDVVVSAPDALVVTTRDGKGMALKDGRLVTKDIEAPTPIGEVSFRAQSALGTTLEAMRLLDVGFARTIDLPTDKIDGKFDGEFLIKVPLSAEVDPESFTIQGKAKISEVKSKEKIGIINVQSGAVDVTFGETEAVAKGELILNGVLAKIDWRRNMSPDAGKQPPLAITANLDNADRKQLGIEVNDYIQGEVPVTVTFEHGENSAPFVRVSADLTSADFELNELAWSKPRGRTAKLQFDVIEGKSHKTELQNFKISGDRIAVDGWVGLGADQKAQEFKFPTFWLDLVSRMDIEGKRGARDVWDVKARGTTFDGKDFFRSLFSFDGSNRPARAPSSTGGINLDAEITNVLGHSDVALRNLKLKLSRRGDTLTALDARGTLDGGRPLAAVLQAQGGARKILADSTDAGQALRLIGFYPNMQGGRVRAEVDLDAFGPAEKSGVVWIENFKVLGDPVVSEVFSGAGSDGPAIAAAPPGQRRVVREVFEFDRLKLPFSVGFGQFVVGESYVKGPILGATLRGKVDYGAQRVNLGGTYIPLQGLNNMLGGIPVLGQILSGPRGEGIFGITFAIQGPMAQPQVIVNPLSLVAPGIFREIFQVTNPNTAVLPRGPTTPALPPDQRVRASSSSAAGDGPGEAPTIDGWSSDTVVPTKRN